MTASADHPRIDAALFRGVTRRLSKYLVRLGVITGAFVLVAYLGAIGYWLLTRSGLTGAWAWIAAAALWLVTALLLAVPFRRRRMRVEASPNLDFAEPTSALIDINVDAAEELTNKSWGEIEWLLDRTPHRAWIGDFTSWRNRRRFPLANVIVARGLSSLMDEGLAEEHLISGLELITNTRHYHDRMYLFLRRIDADLVGFYNRPQTRLALIFEFKLSRTDPIMRSAQASYADTLSKVIDDVFRFDSYSASRDPESLREIKSTASRVALVGISHS